MKKLYTKPLAALLLTLLTLSTQAQITLEHTFENNGITYWLPEAEKFIMITGAIEHEEGNYDYYEYNYALYNADFSLYGTYNSIALGGEVLRYNNGTGFNPGQNLYTGALSVSKHVFNQDDLLEFLIFSRERSEDHTASSTTLRVVNENGQEVLSVGPYFSFGDIYFYKAQDAINFAVSAAYYGSSIYTHIYSLPCSPESISLIQQGAALAPAYPNPSASTVALPYSLEPGQQAVMVIRDMAGRTIEEKRIDSTFDCIMLNVSAYQPGTYLYTVNGQTRKFVVAR